MSRRICTLCIHYYLGMQCIQAWYGTRRRRRKGGRNVTARVAKRRVYYTTCVQTDQSDTDFC